MKRTKDTRQSTAESINPQVTLNPENPDKASGFYYTILFQYYLGLWPSKDRPYNVRTFILKYVVPCQFVRMLYSLYFQCVSIKMVWGDAYLMTEYTMIVSFYLTITVKMATVYFHRDRFKDMLETLESHNRFGVFESKFRTDKIRFNKKWSRALCTKFTTSVVMIMVLAIIQLFPQAYANRRIPLRLYFPYDVTPSPIFDLTLLTMFPLTLFDFLYIFFCDLLIVTLLLNVTSHFQVLRYDIENLQEMSQTRLSVKKTNDSFHELSETERLVPRSLANLVKIQSQICPGQPNWTSVLGNDDVIQREVVLGGVFDEIISDMKETEVKVCDSEVVVVGELQQNGEKDKDGLWVKQKELREEMRCRLGECVKRHQSLIKLALETKHLFKYMLAYQVIMNVFLGVLGLYISTLAKSTDSKVMLISTVLIGGVTEFIFFCWFSENVNEQSGGVATSVYACSWLEMDLKTQKALKLIMTRAQKACVITAAGIPLCRKTFRTVSKLGYYFHALLSRFYWGEKLLKSTE